MVSLMGHTLFMLVLRTACARNNDSWWLLKPPANLGLLQPLLFPKRPKETRCCHTRTHLRLSLPRLENSRNVEASHDYGLECFGRPKRPPARRFANYQNVKVSRGVSD